ncbi:hypothetical protein [Nocardia carnea]|uniref:hypothetical protein n=1 Tax=Nocardia carnea TaxID=37328 RepID=UPI002458936F|nr:hypothetical protein [Nocardia carnea]
MSNRPNSVAAGAGVAADTFGENQVMDKGMLPDQWTIEEVRRRARDSTVELLDSSTPVFLAPLDPSRGVSLKVDLIIGFTGLCLARCADDGEWYMGHRSGPGEPIFCWSGYGTGLGTAIDGL